MINRLSVQMFQQIMNIFKLSTEIHLNIYIRVTLRMIQNRESGRGLIQKQNQLLTLSLNTEAELQLNTLYLLLQLSHCDLQQSAHSNRKIRLISQLQQRVSPKLRGNWKRRLKQLSRVNGRSGAIPCCQIKIRKYTQTQRKTISLQTF